MNTPKPVEEEKPDDQVESKKLNDPSEMIKKLQQQLLGQINVLKQKE